MKSLVPASKIGTPFQSPGWRFQATYFPERFGFTDFCSKSTVEAGHLSRLITKGIEASATYKLPSFFSLLIKELPNHLVDVLIKVWNKHYFSSNSRKITFDSSVARTVPISWNLKKLKHLNDPFLVKLINHCFNFKYDKYINEAIQFVRDPYNSQNKKWLSYSIYAKIPDIELAKKWNKSPKFIEALRLTFFDYSHWPADKLVQYSLIRQLNANREIDDQDLHALRRIFDLGMLGLRSICDYSALNETEQRAIQTYLGSSSVDNMLNLRYTITSSKDALNYNRAVAEYANVGLKKMEIEQKSELLRLTAAKLAKEMGVSETVEIFDQESELLEEMKELSKFNHKPKFPSFIELKAEDVKITVDNNV